MKKEFIVVVFEGHDHSREVAMYDAANYTGDSDGVWYLVRRNSDHQIVLMVPNSRIFCLWKRRKAYE